MIIAEYLKAREVISISLVKGTGPWMIHHRARATHSLDRYRQLHTYLIVSLDLD